jgi:hypothetical protein
VTEERENVAERLMSALITKMESMDAGLRDLKAENRELKKMVSDPSLMLRKAGFVQARTQRPEDVLVDGFRGEISDAAILKAQDGNDLTMPRTNADFHNMEWSEIHALAEQSKDAGSLGNQMGME